jgi:hypothetical protein
VLAAVPERESLSDSFLQHHHCYADAMFKCRQRAVSFTAISRSEFHFEIYASGEYTKLLENEWRAE